MTVTARALLLLAVMLGAPALAQDKPGREPKPPTDNPPIGKAPILLMEDFETTEAGQIPKGYTKQGAVSADDTVAHSGKHSLRMDAAVNGPRRITTKSEVLAQLGGTHWGRLFFKVQLPAPVCDKGVIHSTIVSAVGKSPLHDDEIEFRPLDTILGTQGTFSYIYNVQPHTKRPEFGKGSASKYAKKGTLAGWQGSIATPCIGNPYLIFGLSLGFAGPLLEPLNILGIAFHFHGDSSSGKTTAQCLLIRCGSRRRYKPGMRQ